MASEWELWHTPAKEGYATIIVGDHKESWLIRSQTFKRFVAKQFFDQNCKAMNSEALAAAVNLLEAQALFKGDDILFMSALAGHEGKLFISTYATRPGRLSRSRPQGWQVIDAATHPFSPFSRGMLPLPIPERGGNIDLLRAFLHVDDDTWRLVLAWLVAALRDRGPYPAVSALFAEQGAGKSTTGRLLRELVDPNVAPLRAEPKDGRDLMIAANNSWTLAYDNLSYVPTWLSDALCRLSTGGGFATRELYTDQDEIIFDSQRPVLLTSIEEVATRSDLLDRCLIDLAPRDSRNINDVPRRSYSRQFRKVQPQIIGALLDAVVVALQRLPSIKLPGLPRMADFCLVVHGGGDGLRLAQGDIYEGLSGES